MCAPLVHAILRARVIGSDDHVSNSKCPQFQHGVGACIPVNMGCIALLNSRKF